MIRSIASNLGFNRDNLSVLGSAYFALSFLAEGFLTYRVDKMTQNTKATLELVNSFLYLYSK